MDDDLTADWSRAAPAPQRLDGAPAAIGDVLSGRWSVLEIRRGGQAWVLIVEDLEGSGRRAIKTPLSGKLTGDAELAMLLGLEPHPNVVTVLDVIEIDGTPGIVLEYAPSTLGDLFMQQNSGGKRPSERLFRILQQVCDGMAHLSEHAQVAHLDLKPSNVLVDSAGSAKVADFGLAQQISIQSGRFPSARGGTWAYAAPEVLVQEPCDARSDIFSFGVLLYQACTGKFPYPFDLSRDSKTQLEQLREYNASRRPWQRAAELEYGHGRSKLTELPALLPDEDIALALSGCLMRHMEERYASFRDLEESLARALKIGPSRAARTSLQDVDQERRELALCRVLVRLRRFDEAVNRSNRLLTHRLPPDLCAAVRQVAQDALTGAGRRSEAAMLADWRCPHCTAST